MKPTPIPVPIRTPNATKLIAKIAMQALMADIKRLFLNELDSSCSFF